MVGAEVNGDCKTQQKSLDTISGNKIETLKHPRYCTMEHNYDYISTG